MGVAREPSERTVVERRDPLLGAVFDQRFRVEAKIAAGGFGAIYRASHLDSQREFALKLLHPNLINDPRVVARFRREGAALLLLRDPHTIKAYDLGEAADGTLYIVMELLRGESLYERYRARGALAWPRMLTIARAVCSSLAEAHALGIIHRDLKPTNIHLEARGEDDDHVKVLDFGIAKILQGSDIDSAELTNAGQMIGTLDYMSPEQMVGGECTATTDIYTLGIVMYEMIAGRRPYDDTNSAAAALATLLTTTPARLSSRAQVTPDVDRIVMRCLESQQAGRFQSALELAAALDEVLDGDDAVTLMAPVARASSVVVPPAAKAPEFEVPSFSTTLLGPPPVAKGSLPPNAPAFPGVPASPASAVPSVRPPGPVTPPGPPGPVTPPGGMPAVPTRNLRDAYPMIHRPAPSPMRPPALSPFEDRPVTPPSGLHMRRPRRRARTLRVLVLLGIAIAVIAAIVVAAPW